MKLNRTRDNGVAPEDVAPGTEEQPEQPDTEPEIPAAAETEQEDTGYVETTWANYINYQCTLCPYSTLSREAMEQHVAWHRTIRQVDDWRPPTS